MARKTGWLLFAMFLLMLQASAMGAEKKKIAIGDPKTQWAASGACQGHAPTYADTIANSLRSRIVESGAFRVMNREQMAKILKEHEMGMTGLSDPSSAKVLGQFLQVDLLLGTEVLCHPNFVEFVVSLIDIETTEIVWSKTYQMENLQKVNRALQDIAGLLKKYATTGAIGEKGKGEDLMMINSKALRDASEAIVENIARSIPNINAKIEEVNTHSDTIKVKVSTQAWAGLKLQVKRDDEEIGWIFLKEVGPGSVKAGTQGEISSFEEGDKAISKDFKPKVAVGFIEDEDEANDKMVEMFTEGLQKELKQADRIELADDSDTEKALQKMGKNVDKKSLEKLFQKGLDLVITGRFSGGQGNRRIDFEVISAFDGKRITKIKFDSKL